MAGFPDVFTIEVIQILFMWTTFFILPAVTIIQSGGISEISSSYQFGGYKLN
jgi:hypothetical protein